MVILSNTLALVSIQSTCTLTPKKLILSRVNCFFIIHRAISPNMENMGMLSPDLFFTITLANINDTLHELKNIKWNKSKLIELSSKNISTLFIGKKC